MEKQNKKKRYDAQSDPHPVGPKDALVGHAGLVQCYERISQVGG